ncbi:MAG: hypothetical protein ACRDCA_28605 [Serratia sp. (in: enterobacteria)]|uniref:hypothetical protein n=1 Tax=Serratia sp. (in: enterobacteria) TaxID=616 RepID=UPI003F38540E
MKESVKQMKELNERISKELDHKKEVLEKAVRYGDTKTFMSEASRNLKWEERVALATAIIEEQIGGTWKKTGSRTWAREWSFHTVTLLVDSNQTVTFEMKEKITPKEYDEQVFGENKYEYYSQTWDDSKKGSRLKTEKELKESLRVYKERLAKERSLLYQFKEALRINGVFGKILLFPAFPVFVFYHCQNLKSKSSKNLKEIIAKHEEMLTKYAFLKNREYQKNLYENKLTFEKGDIIRDAKSFGEQLQMQGLYYEISQLLKQY